jgi:rod shape determining protein RodA
MYLIDRRYFRYFDWVSFFLVIILTSIGLFFVFSATYKPEHPFSLFFKKQTFGIISGFIIYLICSATDFRALMRWGYFAYFVIIGLLIFTLFKGHIGMGGQRWLDLAFFRFQPSELAKLFFPAYATYYFYTEKDTLSFSFKQFLPVLCILLISFLLIRKQPDLGTALVLLFSGLIIVWFAGINKKFFIYGGIIILITAPLTWHFLKEYQQKRVLVFLGQGDSKKERYQIEQSLIAIGSGGRRNGIYRGISYYFFICNFIFSITLDCSFNKIPFRATISTWTHPSNYYFYFDQYWYGDRIDPYGWYFFTIHQLWFEQLMG